MSGRDEYHPGFAREYDAPVPYMQRIRDYYQALGYGAPYRWAHYAEVPFQPLKIPLSTTIYGSPTSPSIGCTQLPRTATPGFRCHSCGAAPRPA